MMPKFRISRLPTSFPTEEAKNHPLFQQTQTARATWLTKKLLPHIHKSDAQNVVTWVSQDLTRAKTAVMAMLVMEQQDEKPGKEKHEADAQPS